MRFFKSSSSSFTGQLWLQQLKNFHISQNAQHHSGVHFVFAIPSITGIHSFSCDLQSPQGNAGDFLIIALVLGNNFSVSSCFVLLWSKTNPKHLGWRKVYFIIYGFPDKNLRQELEGRSHACWYIPHRKTWQLTGQGTGLGTWGCAKERNSSRDTGCMVLGHTMAFVVTGKLGLE